MTNEEPSRQAKPPLSQRFDAMPWSRKLALMLAVGVGGLLAAFLVNGIQEWLGF